MQTTPRPTERFDTPYSVDGIPHFRVEETWPAVEGLVRQATDRSEGRYSPESVKDDCIARRMQLWIVGRRLDEVSMVDIAGVVVTRIALYPTGLKALDITLLAGSNADEWLHLFARIAAWGKSNGCEISEMRGRRGWAKKLDWRLTAVEMVKEL